MGWGGPPADSTAVGILHTSSEGQRSAAGEVHTVIVSDKLGAVWGHTASPTLPPSSKTPNYWGLSLTPHQDSKGASHGASGEERKQTVLEHSSTLSLGLRISFWML